jgi:hypothetical protein
MPWENVQPGVCSSQRAAGIFLSCAGDAGLAAPSTPHVSITNHTVRTLAADARRMSYCFGGAVTVRLTVGAEVLVPVLLEITPFESMPTMVKV